MNFLQIKPEQFVEQFELASEQLALSLRAGQQVQDEVGQQMLDAMRQSVDILQRMQADQRSAAPVELDSADVSKVGDYGLELLDELSILAASRGLQQAMLDLQRLSIPLALWVADLGGHIDRLDIVVNAFAGHANEIRDPEPLLQLSEAMGRVVNAASDAVKQDLEAGNPMRPWRILNLNWGIVATRSHDTEEMERVFSQLMNNIPVDAGQFFQEGMQQMDIVGYPDHVREVMDRFNRLVGNSDILH